MSWLQAGWPWLCGHLRREPTVEILSASLPFTHNENKYLELKGSSSWVSSSKETEGKLGQALQAVLSAQRGHQARATLLTETLQQGRKPEQYIWSLP